MLTNSKEVSYLLRFTLSIVKKSSLIMTGHGWLENYTKGDGKGMLW